MKTKTLSLTLAVAQASRLVVNPKKQMAQTKFWGADTYTQPHEPYYPSYEQGYYEDYQDQYQPDYYNQDPYCPQDYVQSYNEPAEQYEQYDSMYVEPPYDESYFSDWCPPEYNKPTPPNPRVAKCSPPCQQCGQYPCQCNTCTSCCPCKDELYTI